jgi:hypothetical protein
MTNNNFLALKASYFFIILLLVITLVTGIVGYYLGTNRNKPLMTRQTNYSLANNFSNSNTFFDTQSATVNGKITKIDGKTLTVQNSRNQSQTFMISDRVFISTVSDKGTISSSSADLSKIKKGQNAFISLVNVGTTYKIASITYMNSIQPTASPR